MYVRIADTTQRAPAWREDSIQTLLAATQGTRLHDIRDPLRYIIARMICLNYLGTIGRFEVWWHNDDFYANCSSSAPMRSYIHAMAHATYMHREPTWCRDRVAIANASNLDWHTGYYNGNVVLILLNPPN